MLVLVGIRHFPCGTARQAGEKKRARGEEEWRGEGRGRGRLKHERWWGDAREEGGGGGLVSRDNRRRGANQPRIRKAASCCSRVVCVASRVYRVSRYRGKDAYAHHLYYVVSRRLALSSHLPLFPPLLFNRSTRLIAREQSVLLPSCFFDRG